MITVDNVLRLLTDVGRQQTGGREQLTLRDVYEARGGSRRGAGAARSMAADLGVTPRQVQRMITEHGTERRGMGPKSVRYFREMGERELRRAGARYLRDHSLVFGEGTFALCYLGIQAGDEREIRRGQVAIDNGDWLDLYEQGDYAAMARAFTELFLEDYGVDSGLGIDVCDEDGGGNLHVAR